MAELYTAERAPEGSVQVFAHNGALVVSFDEIDEVSLSMVLEVLRAGEGDWEIQPRNPSGSYFVRSNNQKFFLTCKSLQEAATLKFHLNRKVA